MRRSLSTLVASCRSAPKKCGFQVQNRKIRIKVQRSLKLLLTVPADHGNRFSLGMHSGLWEFYVAKAEWGTKRVCLNCSVRFYDMLRDPILCPSCETPFDPTANLKTRRTRTATKAATVEKVAKKKEVVEEEEETEEEVAEAASEDGDSEAVVEEAETDDDDDEESESAIEDVSELGDDDVSDVIDVEGGDEETT